MIVFANKKEKPWTHCCFSFIVAIPGEKAIMIPGDKLYLTSSKTDTLSDSASKLKHVNSKLD